MNQSTSKFNSVTFGGDETEYRQELHQDKHVYISLDHKFNKGIPMFSRTYLKPPGHDFLSKQRHNSTCVLYLLRHDLVSIPSYP